MEDTTDTIYEDENGKPDQYCSSCANPPEIPIDNMTVELRDYQNEAIWLIKDANAEENVILDLPTRTGKNIIIQASYEDENGKTNQYCSSCARDKETNR